MQKPSVFRRQPVWTAILVSGFGWFAASRADAAVITWQSAGTFTTNSVELTSNVQYAVDVGSGAAVTDSATGVTFGADNGSHLLESSSEGVATNSVFLASGSTGDASLDTVLNSADFPAGFTHEITYTLENLTAGTPYSFEILLADTRPVYVGRLFNASQADGSAPSVSETYAFPNGSPAVGAYAIGTFTADATTESFQLLSSNAPPPTNDGDPDVGGQLNGVILTTVPEPGSLSVLLVGVPLLLRRRQNSGN